jgi:NAD(P)-dependent dehydrogenase (short-subunit alcohol dehydrogenase family)
MDGKINNLSCSQMNERMMSKTVLITGATGNLGGAVLKKFLEKGFQAAALVSDRRPHNLKSTDRLKPFPVDLLDENSVKQTARQVAEVFGQIDMAVLTAGGFAMGGLADTGEPELEKMYRLNFLTSYHIARQVFLLMQQQEDGGQIILTGSHPGLHPGSAGGMISYALSKSLVFRLAEVINGEGKGSGITASVVVPGTMDTPRNRQAMPDADYTTWVSPAEIADNVYHLFTPAGRQLGETVIKIYGGSQPGA